MFLNTLLFDVIKIYLNVFFKIKLISVWKNKHFNYMWRLPRSIFKVEALKYLMNVKHLVLFPTDLLRNKMHF